MSTELTLDEQATNNDTRKHIATVGKFVHFVVKELLDRADVHDQSKLEPPEVADFTKHNHKLPGTTYGSAQGKQNLADLADALAHHYAKNDHHPQHFPEVKSAEVDQLEQDIEELNNLERGLPIAVTDRLVKRLKADLAAAKSSINGMDLIQLLEMFCDWKASTLRHHDGNLRKSIVINTDRYGLSPQLVRILENTATVFDQVK